MEEEVPDLRFWTALERDRARLPTMIALICPPRRGRGLTHCLDEVDAQTSSVDCLLSPYKQLGLDIA